MKHFFSKSNPAAGGTDIASTLTSQLTFVDQLTGSPHASFNDSLRVGFHKRGLQTLTFARRSGSIESGTNRIIDRLALFKFDQLTSFFNSHPTAKLLKSPVAAYLLAFFDYAFKTTSKASIPHGELRRQLLDFMDDLHENEPDVLSGDAEAYLQKWSKHDRWLNRFHDAGRNEPTYELTSATGFFS